MESNEEMSSDEEEEEADTFRDYDIFDDEPFANVSNQKEENVISDELFDEIFKVSFECYF